MMTSVAKIIVIGAMIAVASAKPASGLEAGEQQQPADRASRDKGIIVGISLNEE